MTGQAASRRGGSRLSAMVGLRRAPGNQSVAPASQGLADQKLELTDLVAAQPQAGQVVSFHEETRAGQSLRETRELHERRRKETQ